MSIFKKAARKLNDAVDDIGKTVNEVGEKISETAKEAKDGLKETIENATKYTPEDFAKDYFGTQRKIKSLQEDLSELSSEVEVDLSKIEVIGTTYEKLEQGTVLYVMKGGSLTSYIIVNELKNDGVSFTDIKDREYLFDQSKYFTTK